MTEDMLVHRVFGFLLGLAQHEVCEFFRYDNVRIFNPHTNVSKLKISVE